MGKESRLQAKKKSVEEDRRECGCKQAFHRLDSASDWSEMRLIPAARIRSSTP